MGKTGRKSELERFWAKVCATPNCWWWLGGKCSKGYGTFHSSTTSVAHRWSYMHFRGPITKGLVLDHLCRRRWCVNPWHLRITTNWENIMSGEGLAPQLAAQTHCKRGHPFDAANTGTKNKKWRYCKRCYADASNSLYHSSPERREYQREWKRKRKEHV